jgi:F-type H+-transporting ATPase subunit gamma
MSSAREIRTKISSIKSTQKITKAMQMVAASKMRKAQERMQASRPYATKIFNVIQHLATSHPEYQHIYLRVPETIKRVGFIVVTTDRGLCGGLNTGLLKETFGAMHEWHIKKAEHELCLIGTKGEAFFHRYGGNVVAQAHRGSGKDEEVKDIIGAVKVMLDAFSDNKLDMLYVCYNEFVNTMVQKPKVRQLLPIVPQEGVEKHYWNYIYEPDSKKLLSGLLDRYVEMLVYQGCVENNACEQAARMFSMKSATENAANIIDDLQLVYNKARQATITNEISEIVNGANAIEGN